MLNSLKIRPQKGPYSLFPDLEFIHKRFIGLFILCLQVLEVSAPLSYHLEKSLAGVQIIFVTFQVFRQLIDTLREDCRLNLCAARILIMDSVSFKDFLLIVVFHRFVSLKMQGYFSATPEQKQGDFILAEC
jgi:hypothetical protein